MTGMFKCKCLCHLPDHEESLYQPHTSKYIYVYLVKSFHIANKSKIYR